jgi:2-methylcitrate dehydratase PrpD
LRTDILANLTGITETLGKEFEINKNIFKPHATCGYNQIGVDIVLEMAKRKRIDLGDVDSVKVYVAPDNKAYPGGDFHGPFSSIDQALLSKPFSVATALSRGKVSTDIYLSELDSADILELAEKISTVAVDGMGFLDTKVEMKLKDGTVVDADQNIVDMTGYSLNKDKVIEKLSELSAGSFKQRVAKKLGSKIFDFPEIENIADFFADLRSGLGT